MKIKEFIAGMLTGVAAGILVNQVIKTVEFKTPAEEVLKNVKEAFKKEGPIDGSWIVMKPEPYQIGVISLNVYRGGISRVKNGELEQYEFAADAETGTVVELVKKSS